jgi:hypothetical protein
VGAAGVSAGAGLSLTTATPIGDSVKTRSSIVPTLGGEIVNGGSDRECDDGLTSLVGLLGVFERRDLRRGHRDQRTLDGLAILVDDLGGESGKRLRVTYRSNADGDGETQEPCGQLMSTHGHTSGASLAEAAPVHPPDTRC